MRQPIVEALTWALELQPDPTALKWPVAVLAAAFFGLLLFAVFQYQTSERRWGIKLVLGLLGGAVVVGLGASAFHWVTGVLYGVGYLLTWLAWVLTARWSWWRRALARGLTAGLTLGPWLWLGATEKSLLNYNRSELIQWLLTPHGLVWFWMVFGVLWLLLLVGGWDCWGWSGLRPQRRRWPVVTYAVLGVLGLNWYAAGRVDLFAVCDKGQHWRLAYVLLSRPGGQWYKDDYGQTPLHRAAYAADAEAIHVLLATGADVHAQDKGGRTPLHCGDPKDVDWQSLDAWILGNAEAIRLLLAAGAKVNERCASGATPLDLAGTALARDVLRQAGGKTGEELDRTSLHAAALAGDLEGIRLLLATGADVNAKTGRGTTPLHHAADEGRSEAIRLLLAAGAKVNERTSAGQTALDLASNDACRKLLREAGGKTGLDAEKQAPPK